MRRVRCHMLTTIEAYGAIESYIRMSATDSICDAHATTLSCSCNRMRPWNAEVSCAMRKSGSVSNCCMPQPVHFDVMNMQSGSVAATTITFVNVYAEIYIYVCAHQ